MEKIRLVLNDNDNKVTVGLQNGIYNVIISKRFKEWAIRVGDLFSYAKFNNIDVIHSLSKSEIEEIANAYQNHNFMDDHSRDYEPLYLVHSTDYDSWIDIKNSGYIKSWNTLKREGHYIKNAEPFGKMLGDLDSFSDYVMLSDCGISGEIVVASKQHNKMVDERTVYKVGARLYLDAFMLANDGLLIRDGIHLKVKDRIDIDKYVLFTITRDDLIITDKYSTPKDFTKMANYEFYKHISKNPNRVDKDISLIPYYPDDDKTLAWYQDVELVKKIDNKDEPYTLDKLQAMYHYLDTNGDCFYISYRDQLVGDVTLLDSGEIAIVIIKPYQNKHIGRKVIRSIIELAKLKGFDRVYMTIYDFNVQSQRMAKSVGFEKHEDKWVIKIGDR